MGLCGMSAPVDLSNGTPRSITRQAIAGAIPGWKRYNRSPEHPMATRISPSRPATLFYSYAHIDEKLRDKLGVHLAGLRREGVLTDWHDRDITAGTDWEQAINGHLDA